MYKRVQLSNVFCCGLDFSIEGELVPRQGDQVTYRLCPIPPKLEKFQAIHVRITNFTPEVHLRWDSPLREEEKAE